LLGGWRPPPHSTILCGGEALPTELATELASNGSAVWNLYGPTETTVYSSAAEYRPGSSQATVTIGRPIRNTQIYIVDDRLQPVPIGVPGQLCIAGDGLARGYLRRPDLTAESFIPNPYSAAPGARLYKTGDLGRYVADHSIEYLGRIDHQVKLRGFRIELGEIEAVLAEHEKVRQAVVVAREDCPGEKQLVAYVVPENGVSNIENELRSFLKTKLPDYMIPPAFVFLTSLARTANGKLDRRALPAPDVGSRRLPTDPIGPRSPLEGLVADIWAEVLKLDTLSVQDNFFDLGGHSLKATQVISRVREIFQLDLPIRVLFEAPTVGEFTRKLNEKLTESGALEELERCIAEIHTLSGDDVQHRPK
jgi:acyl carrier protein